MPIDVCRLRGIDEDIEIQGSNVQALATGTFRAGPTRRCIVSTSPGFTRSFTTKVRNRIMQDLHVFASEVAGIG